MHRTDRTPLRRIRVTAALAITSIALISCASTVREGSVASTTDTPPASEQLASPSAAAAVEPATTETQSAETVQITGNYRADVRATGYDSDDFDELLGWLEGHLCEDPMGKGKNQLFNDYDRWVERMATDDQIGPDLLRVVVEYRCPERSKALNNILDRI